MNNKHLACVLLGVVIVLLAYFTMNMNSKMSDMKDQAGEAKRLADDAYNIRTINERALAGVKKDSAPARSYLAVWRPIFEKSGTADEAETAMLKFLKEDDEDLIALSSRFAVISEKGDAKNYVTGALRGQFTFVGEYPKCMNWLGKVEQKLQASRVTMCRIEKAQSSNDIRMEVYVDLPLGAGALENEQSKKS